MLSVSAVFPGLAVAGEVDSEGEGIVAPVEAPAPDFDPGGEEPGLEETPAVGGSGGGTEESEPVESEPEQDTEAPVPSEVSGATTDPVEEAPPQPAAVPEVATPPAEPEPAPQKAPARAASEPVENQQLQAPRQARVERHAAGARDATAEAPPPAETSESQPIPDEPPTAPDPTSASSRDPGRSLAGKRFYAVQPGDCLSYIAAALLPPDADTVEIEEKVEHLWRLNEDRIGTSNRNLIYPGTVLRLR
jgi:hypothetical protein